MIRNTANDDDRLAYLACLVEGDPCARLCQGWEGSDWTHCYTACEEGQ